MSLSIEKIEKARKAMIAQAKSIYDQTLSEKPITLHDAINSGMIKKSDLKSNTLYYGYAPATTEAIWNEKKEIFVGKATGIDVTLEYFENFIPTVDASTLEFKENMSLDELQAEYKKALVKYEEAEQDARKYMQFRDKQLMKVHQIRKRFEEELKK